MQESELRSAVAAVEIAAKRERERIQLGFCYISTAENLRQRAAASNPKDAAILIDAAEDLELKAQAIFNEVASPKDTTERMMLTAAGFFGVWASPLP